MGYNNNNAGMHMIWHRRYGLYDDLEYYDRLAEKRVEDDEQRKDVDNRMDMNQPSQKQKKHKMKSRQCNKHQDLSFPKAPAYGTEKVIHLDNIIGSDIVTRNIMLIALKRKFDIKKILLEVEDIMKKDERTNPKPSWDNPWSWLPKLDKSVIFLNILAEKLDCSIIEFFIDDEKTTKQFLCKFLADIDEDLWWSGDVDSETGQASICIYNYGSFFKEDRDVYSELSEPLRPMDLLLEKDLLDDGTFWYSLAYGSLINRPEMSYDYAGMGAYLWEEREGMLKEYIEDLIAKHPEWIKKDDV